MNCQEYQGSTTEGLVKQSARRTPPPPPASPLLNWIHVIDHPDRETRELDLQHALSAASQEGAPPLHAE